MNYVATVIGTLAAISFIWSYQQKRRSMIVLMGTIARILFVVQYFMLGAMAGAVMNIIGVIVAFLAQRKDHPILKKYLPFVIAAVHLSIIAVGIAFYQSPFDIFVLVGTTLQLGALWFSRERTIRAMSLAGAPCWLTYNIASRAYPCIVSDSFTICSLLIAMIRFDLKRKPKQQNPDQ